MVERRRGIATTSSDVTAAFEATFDAIETVEDPHRNQPPLAHPRLVRRSARSVRQPRAADHEPVRLTPPRLSRSGFARGTSPLPVTSDFEDAETWYRW